MMLFLLSNMVLLLVLNGLLANTLIHRVLGGIIHKACLSKAKRVFEKPTGLLDPTVHIEKAFYSSYKGDIKNSHYKKT